jgi:hypothetical protein
VYQPLSRIVTGIVLSVVLAVPVLASEAPQAKTSDGKPAVAAGEAPNADAQQSDRVPTIIRLSTPESGPGIGPSRKPGTNDVVSGNLGYINMAGTGPLYPSDFGLFMWATSGLYLGARIGGNTSSTAFIFYNSDNQEILRIKGDKNVAIGSFGGRSARLEVTGPMVASDVILASGNSAASTMQADAAQISLLNPNTTNGNHARIDFGTFTTAAAVQNDPFAPSLASIAAVFADHSPLRPRTDLIFIAGDNLQERMRITSTGRIGIGTAAPGYALDVVGDAHFSGEVTGGTIRATYQDVAEWVPAQEAMAPATVVVLSRDRKNEVVPSFEAYDTMVAGVVSRQPGLILGVEGASKAKIATTGRVKVRVDATAAPIAIGDLLVTSAKSGMAMRSEPMEINGRKFHQPGTIIGKALEPLAGGEGEILVLLSLQ